ncbi:MAG: TAXI family TRAP transporter solute-binding subunit [Bacillota bacterium]
MNKKTKRLSVIILAVVLSVFMAGCGGSKEGDKKQDAKKADPVTMSIASGKAGGTWYPMGGALAEIVQQSVPGSTVSTMQGTGDANIIGVNNGQYTMGLSFSFSNADAYSGTGTFEGKPQKNIAGMVALYNSPLQIVVRADSNIKSIEDLKGKRIAPGLVGTSGEVLVRNILKVHGLTYKDMAKVEHLAYADAAMLMQDGHLDAFMPFTTVPAPVIQDLAVSTKGVRLLTISPEKFAELKKINPGYSEFAIKANSYQGQTEDVVCVGSNNVVIVQKSLSEDLVYKMVKGIVENKKKMTEVHQVMKDWNEKFAPKDIGVELHPGAVKYYKEIGAL